MLLLFQTWVTPHVHCDSIGFYSQLQGGHASFYLVFKPSKYIDYGYILKSQWIAVYLYIRIYIYDISCWIVAYMHISTMNHGSHLVNLIQGSRQDGQGRTDHQDSNDLRRHWWRVHWGGGTEDSTWLLDTYCTTHIYCLHGIHLVYQQ